MLRVLNGHSLDTRALLYPESMGLNLSERDSTATPTAGVGPDVPKLKTGDWVQDMDEPGAGIVWRVKTADTQYNTETITYTLEHIINSLADRILPDEVKAEDMGGSGGSCTAKQAAQYVLGKQSDWVLGDFEYSVSNPYRFSGETLKAALETISNSLENPVWEYDFSVYPFRLHIRQQSDAVDSELRADRNLTTLKYTIDRTRMYTRFYPVGKNNLKPAGKYVSKNEDVYGRVDKTETDQSKDTEAKLIAWANERLERHAEPLVTVTISGLDLSEGTGESLDKMTVCHKCRVPLPAYGTTIVEKVTKLAWRDKIKDKESVTVTLANALADVQSIIKEEKSKSGGGGRTAAELNYGIETTIGDVESGLYTRITQTASELRQEAHDEARSLRSIISQTAESIRLMVEDDVSSLRSQIIQTAESIRLEVENTADSLRSSITQTAESIRLEVANEAASIRSEITQTAESIRLEVVNEAASIRSEITQTAESIRAEVTNEAASIRSSITQTAESIRAEVANEAASIRSEITQTAESIRAEVTNEAASIRSSITQTAESIRAEVTNEAASIRSSITQTAESIRSEVTNEAASIRSQIVQTASSIRSEIENTADSLRSSITQEHNRISLVVEGTGDSACVKRAAIILAINGEGGSTAHIDADQVYIGSQKSTTVIAGKCSLSDVTADFVASRITAAGSISCNNIYAMQVYVTTTEHGTASKVATQAYVNGCPSDLRITSSGNTYTLQKKVLGGTEWTDVGSFSRATTLSAVWSSGKFTVTASPQGDTRETQIDGVSLDGSASINPGNSKYMNVPLKVEASIDGGESATVYEQGAISVNCTPVWNAGNISGYITGYNDNTTAQVNQQTQTLAYGASVTVTAQYYDYDGTLHNSQSSCVITAPADRYSDGWVAAYRCVDLPHNFSTGDHMTVETPPSTVDGTANQTNYYLALDNSYAYIRINSATAGQGVVVARIANTTYAAGWALAYGRVDLPHTFSTSDHITVKTPPSTVGGTATETNYYLSLLDKYAFIRINSATPGEGTAVARVEIPLQEKTVTLTSSQQTIEPDEGYIALKKVTVPANPHPTQYTLHCTGKDHPSSSAPYTYTFTMTITADAYSIGSNYYFYR